MHLGILYNLETSLHHLRVRKERTKGPQFQRQKWVFVYRHWCEENEMVFVSHEVPFPAMSDRRSRVAGNGTKWEVKTIELSSSTSRGEQRAFLWKPKVSQCSGNPFLGWFKQQNLPHQWASCYLKLTTRQKNWGKTRLHKLRGETLVFYAPNCHENCFSWQFGAKKNRVSPLSLCSLVFPQFFA